MKKIFYTLTVLAVTLGCKKDKTPEYAYTFKGIVVHQKDKKPIPNVKVAIAMHIKGSDGSNGISSPGNIGRSITISNEKGEFSFAFSQNEVEFGDNTIVSYFINSEKDGLVGMYQEVGRTLGKHHQDTVYMDDPSQLKFAIDPNSFGSTGRLIVELNYTPLLSLGYQLFTKYIISNVPAQKDTIVFDYSYLEHKKVYIRTIYSPDNGQPQEVTEQEIVLSPLETVVTIEK